MILTIGYLLIIFISTVYNIHFLYSDNCSIIIPKNFVKFQEDLIKFNIISKECDIIIDDNSKNNTFTLIYTKETFFQKIGLKIGKLNEIYLLAYFITKVMYLYKKYYENENKIKLIDKNTKIYKYDKNETNTCAICIEDYQNNDKIRELNCKHFYHQKCIDNWLFGKRKLTCPLCVRQVIN